MAHKQVFIQLTTAAPAADILTAPVGVTRKITGVTIFTGGANAGAFTLVLNLLITAVDWKILDYQGSIGLHEGRQLTSNMDTSVTKLHAVATGLPAAATVDIGIAYTEE